VAGALIVEIKYHRRSGACRLVAAADSRDTLLPLRSMKALLMRLQFSQRPRKSPDRSRAAMTALSATGAASPALEFSAPDLTLLIGLGVWAVAAPVEKHALIRAADRAPRRGAGVSPSPAQWERR